MKKKMTKFAVIGLGRFGQCVARELSAKDDCEVLAIDEDEEKVNAIKDFVVHAVTADATDENVLRTLGIETFDAVIVCIGGDMEASILVSLMCKQYEVDYVVAKAKSLRHKTVLEKLGVDLVVIPEYEAGKKLAAMLANPGISDMLDLGEDYNIIEVDAPAAWGGKSMLELNLRRVFGVNVLLLRRENEFVVNISGETVIKENDTIVCAGETAQLSKLMNKITKLKDKEV